MHRSEAGLVGGVTRWRGQIAPITAISLFGMTMAMSYPLFAYLLEQSGASGTLIGLNTMSAAISMVITAPLLPLVLRWVGIGPLLVGAALILAVIWILVPLGEGLVWWTLLRFLYGFVATALFFGSEFWIVAAAPEASRGRVVALYAIALSGSFILGPLLLQLTGLGTALPFMVGAGVVLAGVVVLVWGLPSAPPRGGEAPPRLKDSLRFFVTDPTLLFAIVLFGSIEYGTLSLITVWGMRSGLSASDAVWPLALFAAGSMALQWPIGRAADRADHRRLLALAAAVAVLAPLAMVATAPSLLLMALPVLVWGGLAAGLYTVALTGLGARYTGQRLAQANAAVVLAYGIGALLSPTAYGVAMDRLAPPDGLLLATSAAGALYLALVLARLGRRRRVPT